MVSRIPIIRHIIDLVVRRAEEKKEIEATAENLLLLRGALAYSDARAIARHARQQGQREQDRHWSRVAVAIARRSGKVVGETAADRMLQDD